MVAYILLNNTWQYLAVLWFQKISMYKQLFTFIYNHQFKYFRAENWILHYDKCIISQLDKHKFSSVIYDYLCVFWDSIKVDFLFS